MTLEKALRWVALAGIFALPFIVLIVSRSLFFPYITGKNFSFRILVEIVGVAWLLLALISPQYRPRRSWIFYAFAAFVVAIGVADLFGVYPFKSLWSNYERMEGWVTLAHLFVYFVAASSVLTPALWRRWWQTSLAVSVLVGIYGLMQLVGLADISTQSGSRLDATFGNATYLAVYMLFHVFVAALFLADVWTRHSPHKRMMPALAYGSIIALDTLVLFFTATRGALLGLLGGMMLSALLLIVSQPRSRIASRAGVVLCAIVLLTGGVWLLRNTALVQSIDPLVRLTNISISDVTTQSRFMNWGMAWQGFKERPILGWGQENYAIVFDKYYDPGMYAQEPWFDRVHSLFLDWLIAGGIVGLLAYLSVYVAALWALWRSPSFSVLERSIVTGLLGGYVFYLVFTFDNITSYLLFVSLLAYLATRASGQAPALFPSRVVPRSARAALALGGMLIAGGVVWSVNAAPVFANRAIIQGLSPQREGLTKNLAYFKEAVSYGTFGTQEAREHLSQTASRVSSPDVSATPEERKLFFETAVSEMARQAEEVPLSARFPFFLGILRDAYGDREGARAALLQARERSPRKQSILFQLGLNAVARGDEKEAVAAFKMAYEGEPTYTEAAVFYATVLIASGNIAEADGVVARLAEKGQALDQRILAAYAAQKRYDKIAEMAALQSKAKPDDVQARFTEAAALYASGNAIASIAVLEETQRALPQAAAAAAALIVQAKAGTWKVE